MVALGYSGEVKLCLCFGQAVVVTVKPDPPNCRPYKDVIKVKFTSIMTVCPSPHIVDVDKTVMIYNFFSL